MKTTEFINACLNVVEFFLHRDSCLFISHYLWRHKTLHATEKLIIAYQK